MTDFTAQIQKPGVVGVAPTYNTATVGDTFTAQPNQRYVLHYKNGATPTGTLKITDQSSASQAPAGAQLAAGWADAQMSASMGATSELLVDIPNSNRFRDGAGKINLAHVTPTTLSFCIMGPFPATQ